MTTALSCPPAVCACVPGAASGAEGERDHGEPEFTFGGATPQLLKTIDSFVCVYVIWFCVCVGGEEYLLPQKHTCKMCKEHKTVFHCPWQALVGVGIIHVCTVSICFRHYTLMGKCHTHCCHTHCRHTHCCHTHCRHTHCRHTHCCMQPGMSLCSDCLAPSLPSYLLPVAKQQKNASYAMYTSRHMWYTSHHMWYISHVVHVTSHVVHVTSHVVHVTSHVVHITSHVVHITCGTYHMWYTSHHVVHITSHVVHITCGTYHMWYTSHHVVHITSHVVHITCGTYHMWYTSHHVVHVTSHVVHVTCGTRHMRYTSHVVHVTCGTSLCTL